MRRLVIVVVLVLAAAVFYRSLGGEETGTGTLTLQQPAPNVGQEARLFSSETTTGGTFRLTDRGTYVLAFWSTLNESSDEVRAELQALSREYGDEDVSFAAVYVNSAPRDEDRAYTILQDSNGRLTSFYNVKRVPRLFVIHDGEISLVQNGYYEENRRQLEEKLDEFVEQDQAATGRPARRR